MPRLAGLRYRDIVKRLKELGFEFARQAADSTRSGTTEDEPTTVPNIPALGPKNDFKAMYSTRLDLLSVLLLCIMTCALPLAAASQATETKTPDTPAGHQLAALLQALDTPDAKTIRAFVEKHIAKSFLEATRERASRPWKNNLYLHVVKGGPAGGGFSTAEDLLKFDIALRNHKLLSTKYTDLVLTGKVALPGSSTQKYAYGFEDDSRNGHRIVGHEGGFPGINSQLDIYLDLGYTVAVMSNYDPPAAARVADRLRDMFTQE